MPSSPMAFKKSPSYLWQHASGAWFLKRPIPPALQKHYLNDTTKKPRTHIVEPLGTHSRAEAEKSKRAPLRLIEATFARLSSGLVSRATDAHSEKLAGIRRQMAEVWEEGGDEHVEMVLEDLAIEAAQEMEKEHGTEAASMAYKLAIRPDRLTLNQALKERHNAASTREQTKAAESKALRDLLEFLKVPDCLPEAVTEARAFAFVDALNSGKLSHATKKGKLSCLGRLWSGKKVKAQLPKGLGNIWQGHDLSGERKSTDEVPEEETGRNWTDTEMVKVFAEPGPRDKRKRTYTRSLFRELHAIGFVTGMRLDEITSLRPSDVSTIDGGIVVTVRKAKTNAGVRFVPVVHPTVMAIINARARAQADSKGCLFHECAPGGPDNKTSWHVGKAMGRDRVRLGLDEVTFHSTRGTFMTLQENAGTNVVHVQRYVGHAIQTVMHKHYSDGSSADTLRSIAEAVRYPVEVEAELLKLEVVVKAACSEKA